MSVVRLWHVVIVEYVAELMYAKHMLSFWPRAVVWEMVYFMCTSGS